MEKTTAGQQWNNTHAVETEREKKEDVPLGHRLNLEFVFMCGTRVDKAGSFLVDKYVVETGLVAADAGVDLVRALLHCLLHEVRVRQKGSRHAHHVRLAYTAVHQNKQ